MPLVPAFSSVFTESLSASALSVELLADSVVFLDVSSLGFLPSVPPTGFFRAAALAAATRLAAALGAADLVNPALGAPVADDGLEEMVVDSLADASAIKFKYLLIKKL